MTVSGMTGPLVVYGQNPALTTGYQPDYNSDAGPSAFAMGTMLLDPRVGYRGQLVAGTQTAVGFWVGADILALDQNPAALAAANIVASAAAASASLTLVTTTGAGVTVSTAPFTFPQSGLIAPTGTCFLDGQPGVLTYGPTGAMAVIDPTKMIARAVSITAAASATATTATVRGWDCYGYAMTETITVTAGSTTNGAKCFKAIGSVTLNAADAGHAYSVGTRDVFGFPLAAYNLSQVQVIWNNTIITVNTNMVFAVTTSPATAITGDVRGSYAVQSASDGTKRLQVIISPSPVNIGSANGATSLFGVTQFAG